MQFNRPQERGNQRVWVLMMCILVGVLGRIMPHLPNVTPMTGLSLFAGSTMRRVMALCMVLVTLAVSDIFLACFYGHPIFSSWTFFVYTGFIFIGFCGKMLAKRFSWAVFPLWVGGSTFFYWLWTNFGVWLTSGMYVKSFAGLFVCYTMALPFLRNALIGDFIWGIVIFGVFTLISCKEKNRCKKTTIFTAA